MSKRKQQLGAQIDEEFRNSMAEIDEETLTGPVNIDAGAVLATLVLIDALTTREAARVWQTIRNDNQWMSFDSTIDRIRQATHAAKSETTALAADGGDRND